MQPISFDFASAFNSVDSSSRGSTAASGNASSTSFSALLQLAQAPQAAPLSQTTVNNASASERSQQDTSVRQSSYAKPTSGQTPTQTPSAPSRKSDAAAAAAQPSHTKTPKKSDATQTSSDDASDSADNSSQNSSSDASDNTTQGPATDKSADDDKKTKPVATDTSATPDVVLELSQLSAATPTTPTTDVAIPASDATANVPVVAGAKPVAAAANATKADASATAALATQNAVNETAVVIGPTTTVATDSAAAQILSTTTSQDKQATNTSDQSTNAVQVQATLAASLAGAAAVVAPQPVIATTNTITDSAPQTTAATLVNSLQRSSTAQPAIPLSNAATGDLTEQDPTVDLSFGTILDSHVAGEAAKQSADATAAAPGDAKPAIAATASGLAAAETTGQLSQTAVHANAAGGTTSADGVAQVDSSRFVQRVEQAFQSVGNQGGSIRLRLSPPDLGTMQIDISVQKGQMTANVQTDTVQARNLLLDNLPALRERLAQHNIKIETFNVDLAGNGSGGMSGQSSQYQNPTFENPVSSANRNAIRATATTTTVDAPITTTANQNGRLNIVI